MLAALKNMYKNAIMEKCEALWSGTIISMNSILKVPKVLLLLESSREYGRELLRGITKYAASQGPWSFIFETEWTNALFLAKKDEADGIIAHIRTPAIASTITKLNIPAVISAMSPQPSQKFCLIKADSTAIGKLAAEHFLSRGFTNFGYCGYGKNWYSKEREKAFRDATKKAGFQTSAYDDFVDAQPDCRKKRDELESIAAWLASLQSPVGIFACNDDLGQKVLEACKAIRKRVPSEIAVLGVDNDEFICNLTQPPLSSVAINGEQAGYEAATILDKLMRGKKPKGSHIRIVVKPTHIAVRQSTDAMAVKDVEINQALRYIARNCNEPITVSDVLGEVLCSRRVLERKFRQVLGKTIKAQIQMMRAEQIAAKLLESDLSISQIAYNMGFSRIDHVCRYFRRRYGMSPSEYRTKYAGQHAQK
jgi:LacI family transcriptional regulator